MDPNSRGLSEAEDRSIPASVYHQRHGFVNVCLTARTVLPVPPKRLPMPRLAYAARARPA